MRSRRASKPRKIVGYCRVSTTEQSQVGFSLEAQRSRIKAFASVSERFQPVDEFIVDDGYSGSTLARPAMTELLGRIDRCEVTAVYVTKLDRLSRNLRDILRLLDLCQRADTALLSASESLDTSSAVGRMVIHLLGTFAEFERGRISERTSDVLGYRRKSRKVYSPVTPFGYGREDDKLVEIPEEQAALAEMRRLHEAGATYKMIIDMLDALNVKPHRGAKWYPSSVRAVLQSRMYAEAVA
jgi:site-specific DNA recombinase